MKFPRTLLTLLAFTSAPFLGATEITPASAPSVAAMTPYNLGDGLRYLRVKSFDQSLAQINSALATDSALIVDLRYAQATAENGRELTTAWTARANKAPLFILVSPQTPATLTSALLKLPRGALTIGVEASLPAPAVVVAQTADADRLAYEALEGGSPLETLISGKVEKDRFDEATLVKEFENGNPYAEPPPEPDPAQPREEKPAAVSDRVLQRALHLHHALLALQRP